MFPIHYTMDAVEMGIELQHDENHGSEHDLEHESEQGGNHDAEHEKEPEDDHKHIKQYDEALDGQHCEISQ